MTAADVPFRALVALAAFAGLRLGEAAGLQVGDLDFLRRTLTVRRQVQRAGAGAVEVRAPKYGSERVVYLADGLLEMLSEHIGRHCPGDDTSRWVVEAAAGLPPHQNTVGHQWRKACKRAQITDLTLHDLRHFYASGLIAAPLTRSTSACKPSTSRSWSKPWTGLVGDAPRHTQTVMRPTSIGPASAAHERTSCTTPPAASPTNPASRDMASRTCTSSR